MFVIIQLTLNIKNFIYLLHKKFIILLSKDNNIIYHIIYMNIYFPYKSDKPNKNIILLQTIIIKFILVRLEPLILQYIKMKQENKDI